MVMGTKPGPWWQKMERLLCREQGWKWHLGAWHHPHTTDRYITGNGFVLRVDQVGAYLLDLSNIQKGPEKYKKPEVKIPSHWESVIPAGKLSLVLQKWLEKPREVIPEKKKAKL